MGFASLRQVSDRIAFSFLSIYAKGFGVTVHRWLRIPFLLPQPLLRRRFCTAPCRGRCLHRPSCPILPELPLNAVTPRLLLRRPTFSVAPEKVGKKMRLDAFYIARCRARFFDALFGRRFVTSPIAFNSGKCTTRICGQTASTSVLLISGILGRLRYCTAYCRGRCLHRPIGNLRIRRRFP